MCYFSSCCQTRGKGHHKAGSILSITFHFDLSPVELNDGLGNSQPQAIPTLLPAAGAVNPVKPLKQVL